MSDLGTPVLIKALRENTIKSSIQIPVMTTKITVIVEFETPDYLIAYSFDVDIRDFHIEHITEIETGLDGSVTSSNKQTTILCKGRRNEECVQLELPRRKK